MRRSPNTKEIRTLSAVEIASGVRSGNLQPIDIVDTYGKAIAADDNNALITNCVERARGQVAGGVLDGPLSGVPFVVKDMFDTAGITTTYGSAVFSDHTPKHSASIIRQLEAAGAIVMGKANQDEFAWGTAGQNPHWGYVRNPKNRDLISGGSSSGSAAAVAAGLCAVALGTDTGGSIRNPAACCGIVGFKPAYGALSLDGCFPLAPSFDTVGILGRSVADCLFVYEAFAGEKVGLKSVGGLRVGVAGRSPIGIGLDELECVVSETALPPLPDDLLSIFLAEAATVHRGLFKKHATLYGDSFAAKLEVALRADPHQANRARESLVNWRVKCERELTVDVLLGDTLSIPVPAATCDELQVRNGLTANTRPTNYLGWPAISLGPLHIAGPRLSDVVSVAMAIDAGFDTSAHLRA